MLATIADWQVALRKPEYLFCSLGDQLKFMVCVFAD